MSIGIVGAIDPGGEGDLSTHYAIAAAYSIQTNWFSRITCHCKRCGERLDKGEGIKVVIAGLGGPTGSIVYFCQACVDWVKTSMEVVVERQAKDAKIRRKA